MDWASGLLGGVAGGANAVAEISEEERRKLAERLKMEALERIHARSAESEHGYASERLNTQLKAQGDVSKLERESAEKISTDRNAVMERISKMELDVKRQLINADKKSTEAQNLRAKIDAFTEARKVLEGGGSTDEANAVLSAAGLTPMEEDVKEPGSEGFLGFGKKDPVIGRRPAGSAGTGAMSGTSSGLKSELDALLAEGRGTAQNKPKGILAEAQAGGAAPSKPDSSGILPSAMPEKIPDNQDAADPSKWKVSQKGSELYRMTEAGPVKMTRDEIEAWKQTPAGQEYFQSPDWDLSRINPEKRRESLRKSFSRQPPKG